MIEIMLRVNLIRKNHKIDLLWENRSSTLKAILQILRLIFEDVHFETKWSNEEEQVVTRTPSIWLVEKAMLKKLGSA
jgi:hypothetical protein